MSARITERDGEPIGVFHVQVSSFYGLPQYGNKNTFYTNDWDKFRDICYGPVTCIRDCPSENVARRIFEFAKKPKQTERNVDLASFASSELVEKIRAYQLDSFYQCIHDFEGRALIALEQGLGKSALMAALSAYYGKKTVILCPASACKPLQKQLKKWIDQDAFILDKGKKKIPEDAMYVIMSYEMAKRNEAVLDTYFECAIADESHYLCNVSSKRTDKLMPFLSRAQHVFLLSGTPQKCKPSQLYAQINILCPDLFDYKQFTERYCEGRINPYSNKWECEGHKQEAELNALLNTFMVRLKSEKVLTLPTLTRVMQEFEVDAKEMNAIKEESIVLQKQFNAAADKEKNYYQLLMDAKYQELWRACGRAKAEAGLKWFLKEFVASDKKWVLFARHQDVMKTIADELTAHDLEYVFIDQNVKVSKRQELLEEIADPAAETRIAVLSLGTCSEIITLCPGATRMVIFELDHTPSMLDQAEKRIHRMGCVEPVTVHYIIAKNSVDQQMLGALKRKRAVNDMIIDG